jgi:hypothetical protein
LQDADSIKYESHVRSLQGLYPGITFLAEFLQHEEWDLGPENPRGFVLKIQRSQNASGDLCYKFADFDVINGEIINTILKEPVACTYLCIQGIDPSLIKTIGSVLDVPPEFFAKHVVADSWECSATNLGNSNLKYPYWISENVPVLPSESSQTPYFQFRYLELRPQGGVEINAARDGADELDLTPAGPSKPCKHDFLTTKRQVSVWSSQKSCGWVCK